MVERRRPVRLREQLSQGRRVPHCDFMSLRSELVLGGRSETVVSEVSFDPALHAPLLSASEFGPREHVLSQGALVARGPEKASNGTPPRPTAAFQIRLDAPELDEARVSITLPERGSRPVLRVLPRLGESRVDTPPSGAIGKKGGRRKDDR